MSKGWIGRRTRIRATAERNRSQLKLGAVLAVSFVIAVVLLQRLNFMENHLESTGWPIVAYQSLRVTVAGSIFLGWFCAGELILLALQRWLRIPRPAPRVRLLCSLFLGAVMVSMATVALGALQLMRLPIVLTASGLLLLLAPAVTASTRRVLRRRLSAHFRCCSRPVAILHVASLGAVVLVGLYLLVVKGMYVEGADGDVWEHYLHYYREVVASGSIAPNELWYHFFHSKAAGHFFQIMVLTDPLSASLGSFLFTVMCAIVVYDLLRRTTKDVVWAAVGAILTLLYFANTEKLEEGHYLIGSFNKHHIVLASLLTFTFWVSVKASFERAGRAELITGILVAAYLGVYVTHSVVILTASLGLVFVASLFMRRWSSVRRTVALGTAALCGLAACMVVNYSVTGMPEFCPSRMMWQLADVDRFESVWSQYQVRYFFARVEPIGQQELGLRSFLFFDWPWSATLMRWGYFRSFFREIVLLAVLLVLVNCAISHDTLFRFWSPSREQFRKLTLILLAMLFLLGTIVVAQGFSGGGSLDRMYTFTGVFMIVPAVSLWSLVLGKLRPATSIPALICAVLCLVEPVNSLWKSASPESFQFAAGAISLDDVLQTTDRQWIWRGAYSHLKQARGLLQPGQRIAHLSYEPGPGYFLPGPPLVTEPSYAYGRNYDRVLFGTPEEAKETLQQMGITHFSVNLARPLFVGIPFGKLFRYPEVCEQFQLCHRDGDFFVMTWRTDDDAPRLPESIARMLELKQQHSLGAVFGADFSSQLYNAVLERRKSGESIDLQNYQATAQWHLQVAKEMLRDKWSDVRDPANREFLRRELRELDTIPLDAIVNGTSGRLRSDDWTRVSPVSVDCACVDSITDILRDNLAVACRREFKTEALLASGSLPFPSQHCGWLYDEWSEYHHDRYATKQVPSSNIRR